MNGISVRLSKLGWIYEETPYMECLLLKNMAIETTDESAEELADGREALFFVKSIFELILPFSEHLLLICLSEQCLNHGQNCDATVTAIISHSPM